METIPESAARTLVRIEVLVLQGFSRAFFLFCIGVLGMPIAPLVVAIARFGYTDKPWWKRTMMLPLWIMQDFGLSVMMPFSTLRKGLSETIDIAVVEWRQRWLNGRAKHLDGRPMLIPTPNEERRLEEAITKSVIADYNEEARRHGQGIPPLD